MKPLLTVLAAFLIPVLALAADEAPKDGPVKIEVAEKQIASGIQLLDVRTVDEWETGYLKGAKRATFGEKDFLAQAKAAADPKKPVLVYCRSGKRTVKAAKELRDAGFTSVLEMEGGLIEWEKAGKPLVKGK
ncbi:rhodanese-like domain-containing protein [Luteolibacter sp. Populi]|uniref:rhodanese-like domain-containing protein n=1 Tax=Luteolibacter sp. Populi TaxID=3230487 RepID=UPI0034678982